MLQLTHIDLRFRATRAVKLPEFSGSAWRGVFGHALRRAACITGRPECGQCPVRNSCTYTEIFETLPPVGQGFLSHYKDAPHPYVMLTGVKTEFARGETDNMRMTLIGKSARHSSVVAGAFSRAVSQLGTEGDLEPLDCQVSTEAHFPEMPVRPQAVRIVLESPLRLRVKERYWRPADFEFAPFFSSLLRRLSQLCVVHGEGQPQFNARELVDAARAVELRETDLRWQEQHRYSNRQRQRIPMGGLLGSFVIHGDLASIWPWIWAGQFVHVGKSTVMGLGRYSVEPLATPPAAASVPTDSEGVSEPDAAQLP